MTDILNLDETDIGTENVDVADINENLLNSLISDSTVLDEAFYSDALPYLMRFASMSLDSILEEPERIKSDKNQVEKEMEHLALKDFGHFIDCASTIEQARDQMTFISNGCENLNDQLPRLASACEEFCHKAHKISKVRKLNHKTLRQHSQLLDILELPSIMNSCIRGGHYEEALEIQQHAIRITKKHMDIPIMKTLVEEIQGSTELLLDQLHKLLCVPSSLPSSLRLVGFMKRLGRYSEIELRVIFLQCRSVYMAELAHTIPQQPVTLYLSKTIDLYRTQLSDIISQYSAIFDQFDSEDESSNERKFSISKKDLTQHNSSGVLQDWLVHQLKIMLNILDKNLPLVPDGSNISNLLSQCMFFGNSMGRTGIDFRLLIHNTFENCILKIVRHHLITAVEIFSQQLKKYQTVMSLDSTSSRISNEVSESTASQSFVPSLSVPPLQLLDFMPLAYLCNGLLTPMNELRKCCPYSLQSEIVSLFENALFDVIERLRLFGSQMEYDTKADNLVYVKLCQSTSDFLFPYITFCFDSLWKSNRPLLPLQVLQLRIAEIYSK